MTYQQEIFFIWTHYTSKYLTIFAYHAIHVQFGETCVRVLLGTGTLDQGYSSSTNICLPFAATVEKMVILAKFLHHTATVVNRGKKS